MGDLDTSVPFPSSFLCFSLVTTVIHDNVMPLRTYRCPTYLLPNFAHTLLLWPYVTIVTISSIYICLV